MKGTPIDHESRTRPAPRWRLWPRGTVGQAALAIVLLLLLVSLILPALHTRDDWHHGNGGKCMANLRQIGLAMQMYANDYGGRLPPDLATLMVAEDLTSDVFVCPATADGQAAGPTTQALLHAFAKPGHCSYVLASPLPQTWYAVTPADVLAYESPGNHSGAGTNVLFGDGRCEFVDDPRAAYLISELRAGFNPPRTRK